MRNINCNDLEFDNLHSAISFIENNNIKLFYDEGDVILCYQSNESDITENWKDISMKTALYFQANLKDEIIGRNILLVFLSKDSVDINIKKSIQSNTYCCRKIVRSNVENIEKTINELMLKDISENKKKKKTNLKSFIRNSHHEVFNLIGEE
ncbi:ABC-three component system middle component 1 [Vibrio alginolyticus]|uniref:ABC-three component system middle component 1 n=1 Tax=Vibrio alginolyticus TaxID=663 RepID=UPI001BD61CB9|nr:ABC-three component system middle component 1 [Vibrio alginolyticus]MBS9921947.1 hypothetical protein [Vibrio alginolyticus]